MTICGNWATHSRTPWPSWANTSVANKRTAREAATLLAWLHRRSGHGNVDDLLNADPQMAALRRELSDCPRPILLEMAKSFDRSALDQGLGSPDFQQRPRFGRDRRPVGRSGRGSVDLRLRTLARLRGLRPVGSPRQRFRRGHARPTERPIPCPAAALPEAPWRSATVCSP